MEEKLTFIQYLRYGVHKEIAGQRKYRHQTGYKYERNGSVITRSFWQCSNPGCTAHFTIDEECDIYTVIDCNDVHDHTNPPSKKQFITSSHFFSEQLNHLLRSGVPIQSAVRFAYIDLHIDVSTDIQPFLTVSNEALQKRRIATGRKFKFASSEVESLKIFTDTLIARNSGDFAYFNGDNDRFVWCYASIKGLEIAQSAEEWHIDSTYKLTNMRVALYAIVAVSPSGSGFPILYFYAEPDDAAQIIEAISVFLSALTKCPLRSIVSDCAKQITNAIETGFHGTIVHRWCAFHVLRAIATKAKKFKLQAKFKKFFDAMHRLTCELLTPEQIMDAFDDIDQSLRNEPLAKTYYEKTWAPYTSNWIHSLSPDSANTNNLNESHFHSLKYRYLCHRFNFRLDELAVAIVTEVYPDIEVRLCNEISRSQDFTEVLARAEAPEYIIDTEDRRLQELFTQISSLNKQILEMIHSGRLDPKRVIDALADILSS